MRITARLRRNHRAHPRWVEPVSSGDTNAPAIVRQENELWRVSVTLSASALVNAVVLATSGGALAAWQTGPSSVVAPAVYRGGPAPALPVLALGGGEVFLELTVSDRGAVTSIRQLRVTAPYTALVIDAVRTWQFTPAEELIDPAVRKPGAPPTRFVESKVLVAALFRPPHIYTGSSLGEPYRDLERPSLDVPFPTQTVVPILHPFARDPGVVIVEARVDRTGSVIDATVKRPFPPFSPAAIEAARQWRFRPGLPAGATAARAYLIFGFRAIDAAAPVLP
jgi:TonB family protein